MSIDFLEIKKYYEEEKFWSDKAKKCSFMLSKIEEVININSNTMFYPKNLHLDDKDLEVYFFFENKLLRGQILKDESIEITKFSYNSLTQVRSKSICYSKGYHQLILNFDNGEEIVFNSKEDTNSSWSYRFEEQLKELVKYLLTI